MQNLSLFFVTLMSMTPLQTNYYAKNDVAPDATYVGSHSLIFQDKVTPSIGDQYILRVYLEESHNELVPLKLLFNPTYVNYPSTITYTIENAIEKTYSNTIEIEAGLTTTASARISVPYIAELQEEISLSLTGSLSSSLSVSSTEIKIENHSIYIDGQTNKFGIYAFFHCAISAYKFYFKYDHYRINNYTQQELYKTVLLHENTDAHVYVPYNSFYNINSFFYFETTQEYIQFCNTWGLN